MYRTLSSNDVDDDDDVDFCSPIFYYHGYIICKEKGINGSSLIFNVDGSNSSSYITHAHTTPIYRLNVAIIVPVSPIPCICKQLGRDVSLAFADPGDLS